MSVTIEEIRLGIISWGSNITGRTGVIGNSGEGPKLGVPYFEVFANQYDNSQFQSSEMISDDEEEISANTNVTIDIDLYGGNPMSDASRLSRSLYAQERYLDLWSLGDNCVGLLAIQPSQDLTFLENGRMKQRVRFSFILNCLLSQVFSASHIENVDITVEVNNKDYDGNYDGGEDPHKKAAICGV